MIYGLQAAGRARFLHPLGFCILQGLELYEKNGGARGGEKERCDIDGAGALISKPDTGCTKFLKEGDVCQKDLAERSYQTKDVEAD